MTARRKKLIKILMTRFTRVLQNEPVFVENGIKGMFGLVLAFGWLHLSPEVSGQVLFVASFLLGMYARMAVTPVARAGAPAPAVRAADPNAVRMPTPEAAAAT